MLNKLPNFFAKEATRSGKRMVMLNQIEFSTPIGKYWAGWEGLMDKHNNFISTPVFTIVDPLGEIIGACEKGEEVKPIIIKDLHKKISDAARQIESDASDLPEDLTNTPDM